VFGKKAGLVYNSIFLILIAFIFNGKYNFQNPILRQALWRYTQFT